MYFRRYRRERSSRMRLLACCVPASPPSQGALLLFLFLARTPCTTTGKASGRTLRALRSLAGFCPKAHRREEPPSA
eukprot:2194863-Prorocentrum_lima.AAC.1